jgi:hypothetical protein
MRLLKKFDKEQAGLYKVWFWPKKENGEMTIYNGYAHE